MPNIVQNNSLPGTATNRQIVAYVQELEDQLRYVLANLGAENMAPDAIKVETLAPDVRKVFADSEQNMARITANAKRIEASVAGKYDKVASIEIDERGITMTGGAINMEADTEMIVKSGGSLDIVAGGKGNISLTEGGGSIDAETGTFTYLNVGGQTVNGDAFFLPVRAAFTENALQAPDVTKPYLWINALTSGGGISEANSNTPNPRFNTISHSYSETYELRAPDAVLTGDQFDYHLSFAVWNAYKNGYLYIPNVSVLVSNGTDSLEFNISVGRNVKQYGTINIQAELTGQTVNLFSGGTLTARLNYGDNGESYMIATSSNVPFLLKGSINGGGGGTGINNTEIKWVTQ